MVPLLLCATATVPSEKIAMIRKRGRRVGFGLFMAGSSTCEKIQMHFPKEQVMVEALFFDLKSS
jgi:hypothetical protein